MSNACATQEGLLRRRSRQRAEPICPKCKAGWAARKTSVAPEGQPVTLVKMFRVIPDFCLWDMTQHPHAMAIQGRISRDSFLEPRQERAARTPNGRRLLSCEEANPFGVAWTE